MASMIGREQWHAASSWRPLATMAAFLVAVAVFASFFDLTFLLVVSTAMAPVVAFLAGYCYRQRVLDRGVKPRMRFLVLKDDPLLGVDERAPGVDL